MYWHFLFSLMCVGSGEWPEQGRLEAREAGRVKGDVYVDAHAGVAASGEAALASLP